MTSRKLILIVDDDPKIVLFTSDYLQFKGYEVITARNGHDGLQEAETAMPNLLILDIMMPEVDGLEVCRRLKANSSTKNIPIIMLTAKGQSQDEVIGLNLGADDYLTKPFDNNVLLARIEALLRRFSSQTKSHNVNPESDLAILHNFLISCFNDEELRTFCHINLNIDYDSLRGEGKEGKARELLLYLQRHSRLPELINVGKQLRPNYSWSDHNS